MKNRWIARGAMAALLAVAMARAGDAAETKLKPVKPPPAKPAALSQVELAAQLEKGLLTVPVYAVMKQYYPDVYNPLLKSAIDGYLQGKSILVLQAQIRPTYLALLKQQLPKAEPALVVSLIDLSRTEVEGLVNQPAACLSFLGLSPIQSRLDQMLPPELAQKDLKLSADILRQTATHPYVRNPPPAPETLPTPAQLASVAYDELPSDDSRRRLTLMGGNLRGAADPADQRVVCEYMVGFFTALLKQTPDDAAAVFSSIR
ncbi:MAG: hypothetical protein ACXU8S_09320 [Phenylobacterium sp.]